MCAPGYVRLLSLDKWVPPSDSYFSESEKSRAHLLHGEDARLRFLAGRYMVRHFLGRELGVEAPAMVPLEISLEGKPFCPCPEAPSFNVSHTTGTVALALSFQGPVGVDLEDRRRAVSVKALARRWFHPEEQAVLDEAGPEAFFRIWTRKEAYLKAKGQGLRGRWSECNTFEEERTGPWIFTEIQPTGTLQLCVVARERMTWAWM